MYLLLSNSTTLERTLVKKLLRNERATHFVANYVPGYILTEFVTIWNGILAKLKTIWNGNNPHEAPVRLRARGLFEFVVGGPVNELGPTSLCTDTGIVQIRLDLGNFVRGGFNGSGSRDAVVAGPKAILVGVTALVRKSGGKLACFFGALLIECCSIDVFPEVGLDGNTNVAR